MSEIIVITKADITPGTTDTSTFKIPVGATKISLNIDRSDLMDASIAIGVQLFLSLDNGKSWTFWGGFGTSGGQVIDSATDKIATSSSIGVELPEPDNPNRQIKATLTVTGICKTGMTVSFR